MQHLVEIVGSLHCDVCVLTGDYRGKTYGPFEAAMNGLAKVRAKIRAPIYAVLGNHDTIQMVPHLEAMNIRVLLNEGETLTRGDQRVHLAGIDDAHFYRADDIEIAASDIPKGDFSILLSHTPEVYRQAGDGGSRVVRGRTFVNGSSFERSR
jgi:predicted MPP superfamily phosphohydrolase